MSPSTSAIQVRRRPGSRRSASSKTLPMVTSRPAVMSVVYQRFTARGVFLLPGCGRMICSGVRAGPPGTATSNTHPVPAIRLWPFSPVPRRLSKLRTRFPGALVRRRRASGRIATPLPSAGIASGGRPSVGFSPVPGTTAWSRFWSWQNSSAAAAAAAVICPSCRLPMLIPAAASTSSCAWPQEPDRLNISARRCNRQEYPSGGKFSTASRGNSDPAPLTPDRYAIRRTLTSPSVVTTARE
jgi:hypothetical protein